MKKLMMLAVTVAALALAGCGGDPQPFPTGAPPVTPLPGGHDLPQPE